MAWFHIDPTTILIVVLLTLIAKETIMHILSQKSAARERKDLYDRIMARDANEYSQLRSQEAADQFILGTKDRLAKRREQLVDSPKSFEDFPTVFDPEIVDAQSEFARMIDGE